MTRTEAELLRSMGSRVCALAGALLLACGGSGSNSETPPGTQLGGSSGGSSTSAGQGAAGSAGSTGGAGTASPPLAGSGVPGGSGGSSAAQADASTPPAAGSGGMPAVDAGQDAGSTHTPPRTLAERVCPSDATFGDPLPANRTATLIQGGFGFLEGPVWLAEQGVLLFSDMDFSTSGNPTGPAARIRRLTPPSSFDVFLESSSSNGLALDEDGALIACSHGVQSLVRIDPSNAALSPLALTFQGDHFNSPNDVTVRSDGTFYFTDPDWQLGPRSSETDMTGVYRVANESQVTLVIGTLDKPNGIALAPDERTLYVGSAGSDVLAFELDENGMVGSSRTFASPGASDGMGVDCAGNLYVTSGGEVKVYAPDGSQRGAISVAMSPSNVAFGGADRRTLYITAGAGLYSIQLNVPGLPY